MAPRIGRCWRSRRHPAGGAVQPDQHRGAPCAAHLFQLLACWPRRRFLRCCERVRGRWWIRPALAGSAGLVMRVLCSSSHPDYLPYTNELAGSEPEKVLADSDLDWGQDMKRLAARLTQEGATQVTFDPIVLADSTRAGMAVSRRSCPGNPTAPAPGWNAVSLTRIGRHTPSRPARHPSRDSSPGPTVFDDPSERSANASCCGISDRSADPRATHQLRVG